MTDYAWHVSNGLTRGGEPQPEAGETVNFSGEIAWMRTGLYASRRLLDCLTYATGSVVQRVAIRDVVREGHDKLVCRERTCVWKKNIERELRDFARWVALDAFTRTGAELPPPLRAFLETGDGADEVRDIARLCGSRFAWNKKYDPYELSLYDAAFPACWQGSWDAVGYPAHIAARDSSWAASFAVARHDAMASNSDAVGRVIWTATRAAHEAKLVAMVEAAE